MVWQGREREGEEEGGGELRGEEGRCMETCDLSL